MLKRLVDYICDNLNKKSIAQISKETGLEMDVVFEITQCYKNEFVEAKAGGKSKSVWFTQENEMSKIA